MNPTEQSTPAAQERHPMTEKRLVGTIDLTPSWAYVALYIAEALENGTPAGRKAAREELGRMAALADAWVAEHQASSE